MVIAESPVAPKRHLKEPKRPIADTERKGKRADRPCGIIVCQPLALGCNTGRYPADSARRVEIGVSSFTPPVGL